MRIPTFQKILNSAGIVTIILFFVVLESPAVLGQKVEMENRIRPEDFPRAAMERLTKDFPVRKRTKYYRELSSADSLTFEAKFRSGSARYSVEFYPDGRLADVEKQIKFDHIPPSTQGAVRRKWEADFQKFKVVKCQEQTSDQGIRYELEVRGKSEDDTAFYEYLFDAGGGFLNREKIVLRPSDMTLY